MLAVAITSKVEAGNFRAAVHLLCSEETLASNSDDTFEALKAKHPPAPQERRPAAEFKGNLRFSSLQVSSEDVIKTLRTFPAGSSGGPDGLTAQHVTDLLAGAPDEQLKTNLTDFVNIVLQGELPTLVNEILFGGRLIALQTKDGGIRPIAVGYTLGCLVAKCVNAHVIKRRSDELQPMQVGVGVSGGAEAAVNAMQRLVTNVPDGHVVVKLDFSNAYNTIRRDSVLDTGADKMPELYRFIHASLSGSPKYPTTPTLSNQLRDRNKGTF